MPGQGKYRETHTADYMTDYQARRLGTRYAPSPPTPLPQGEGGRGPGEGKARSGFVHMNDATTLAIGRTLIAIMENYQQKDGSIKVPEVLTKYCRFDTIR